MHDAHRHLLIAHPPHRFLPRDFAARGGRGPATLLQGFLAEGREVVGLRTTSAVVQAIFMVIVLDAFFAVFFTEIGWA